MAFPASHTKTIILNNLRNNITSLDMVFENIQAGLRKAKATNIVRHQNVITFNGGLFRFVLSSNILLPVTFGEITVTEIGKDIEINYHLKFTQMLKIVSIIVPLFFGTVLIIHGADIFLIIAFLSIAWLCLFGMNYLMAVLRFPSFVRKSIKLE